MIFYTHAKFKGLSHINHYSVKENAQWLTLYCGPHDYVFVSGVGRTGSFVAGLGDVRGNDRRICHVDCVVHRVVEAPFVLLRRPYCSRILLPELRHRVRRNKRILGEMEDKAHHLVLALATLFLPEY